MNGKDQTQRRHTINDPAGAGDIESNPSGGNPSEATTPTGIANKAFSEIYRTIRGKSDHVDSEKSAVYRRLMDHLDAVENSNPTFTFTLISLELLVLSGLTAFLVCTLTLEKMKHRRFLRLRYWQWVTMSLMILSGLSVVRFATFVVSWPVNRWWRTHKYVVFFTRQLKRCVDFTLWFCIVLLGWYLWFRPRLRDVHGDVSVIVAHQVTRFLIALCIGSFLWLLKNVLYLKLAADLHYDQLFERLRQTVVYLHGIQIIHNRGMWRFLADNKIKKKLRRMAAKSQINPNIDKDVLMKGDNIWMDVMAMDKETVPIWILRRLTEEYLVQVKIRPLPGHSDVIRDDRRLIREAKKLFKQLVCKGTHIGLGLDQFSDYEVKREDLNEYGLSKTELDFIFKPRNKDEDDEEDEDETIQASSIESHADRTIGHDEFLNWAVRAYKNCWGLEKTLCSSKRVFIKLNRLLSAFLLMVVLIIWLLLSKIVDTAQLALLFAPFLAASFTFGDSSKKMFEGLIFAFAMHPFDVGDRVIIHNIQMRVTQMNILTSVFYKYDTGEEVITPNSTLTTTSIINLDITPDQSDKVEFVVNSDTPLEDIIDLEIKIKKMLDDDFEYSSNNKVVKSEIGKEEMKMAVHFKYLVSYLTVEAKAVHKSKILSNIMKLRKDMEINKKVYPPSYRPYIVVIDLVRKLKLKDNIVDRLQAEILSGLEEHYYMPHSKVVMIELTKSRIKMGLYVNGKEHKAKEEAGSEIHPNYTQKACKDQEMKMLDDISERLKKITTIVREVKINDGDDEVIAQGGRTWGSFGARAVIQSQDQPSTSLQTIPSVEDEEAKAEQNDELLQQEEQIVDNFTESEGRPGN